MEEENLSISTPHARAKTANGGELGEFLAFCYLVYFGQVFVEKGRGEYVLESIHVIERKDGEDGRSRFFYTSKKAIDVYSARIEEGGILLFSIEKNSSLKLLIKSSIEEISSGNFANENIKDLFNIFRTTKLKSASADKADIRLLFKNEKQTGYTLGYTIKTIGIGRPSLINASKATMFKYSVLIDSPFTLSGKAPKKLLSQIREHGSISFSAVKNNVFNENLGKDRAEICQLLLLERYVSKSNSPIDLIERVSLTSSYSQVVLTREVKRLFVDFACGMKPSVPFLGGKVTQGGFIFIEPHAEGKKVRIKRLIDSNTIEDDLLSAAEFDTGSTTKHGFGFLYRTELEPYSRNLVFPGQYFIDLCFSVRLSERFGSSVI